MQSLVEKSVLRYEIKSKIKVKQAQNISNPNSAKMHFRSKFGPSKFNTWWVIVRTTPNMVKILFIVKIDLEEKSQSTSKLLEIWAKVFCNFCTNLVVQAWTRGEFLRGQDRDWHRDGQTDGWTDASSENSRGPKLASVKNSGSKTTSITIFLYLHQCGTHAELIKSPRYIGGDFMFLYRFVRRRRPQILVHAITFEQLFGFLSFLAQLLALTYRLTD